MRLPEIPRAPWRKYRELVRHSNRQDQPFANYALGRALERHDDADGAITAYREALRHDPQYAGAHLRLAVLFGRKRQLSEALKSLGQAEAIYKAMSNTEGLAEVHLWRGQILNLFGRAQDSRVELERALELARTPAAGNLHQQIRAMLQLGVSERIAERPVEAQRRANEALKLANDNGLENLATQGLIDLGHTYLVRPTR